MGRTTAGLPLRAGEHHEKCPACRAVFRTKRRTRFRCPICHRLAYALADPGTGYVRRAIEGDERTFRIYAGRAAEGATPETGEDTDAMYLEDPTDEPPAVAGPPSPAPGPRPDPIPTRTARTAAADRDRGPGILGRIWRGSLGDVFRRG